MDDNVENIENLVIIAIIILLIVFIGSLVALIVICYQRKNYLKTNDFFRKHFTGNSFGKHSDNTFLITGNSGYGGNNNGMFKNIPSSNMELDDVRLQLNTIDQILSDTRWVDDATGLVPHCLALLKGCHHLTERLVAATMSAMPRFTENEQRKKLIEIGRVAPTISPRVDDVVEAMYPPLDPRLLESRCLSLLLSVSRFAIVIIYTCAIRGQWIEDELKGLELQLKILREVGQALLINGEDNNSINNNSKSQQNLKQVPSTDPVAPGRQSTSVPDVHQYVHPPSS